MGKNVPVSPVGCCSGTWIFDTDRRLLCLSKYEGVGGLGELGLGLSAMIRGSEVICISLCSCGGGGMALCGPG